MIFVKNMKKTPKIILIEPPEFKETIETIRPFLEEREKLIKSIKVKVVQQKIRNKIDNLKEDKEIDLSCVYLEHSDVSSDTIEKYDEESEISSTKSERDEVSLETEKTKKKSRKRKNLKEKFFDLEAEVSDSQDFESEVSNDKSGEQDEDDFLVNDSEVSEGGEIEPFEIKSDKKKMMEIEKRFLRKYKKSKAKKESEEIEDESKTESNEEEEQFLEDVDQSSEEYEDDIVKL